MNVSWYTKSSQISPTHAGIFSEINQYVLHCWAHLDMRIDYYMVRAIALIHIHTLNCCTNFSIRTSKK